MQVVLPSNHGDVLLRNHPKFDLFSSCFDSALIIETLEFAINTKHWYPCKVLKLLCYLRGLCSTILSSPLPLRMFLHRLVAE